MGRLAVLLLLMPLGCDFRVDGLSVAGTPDGAPAQDLAVGGDLAAPLTDLAGGGSDLALPPDLGVAPMPDLTPPPDLTPVCGPAPPSTVGPGPSLGITLSQVMVNGGGNTGFVAAGARFSLSAHYSITQDSSCPNCIDQILIGLAPNDPQTCLYDGIPTGTVTGTMTVNLTAPTTPGTYTVRFHAAQANNCNQAVNNWWSVNGAPTSAQDFAAICVQ